MLTPELQKLRHIDNIDGQDIPVPLTRGRIEYLHRTRNNDTEEYWSIDELFLFNPELCNQTELERMQSPHREELKKLLIEFSNYL